MFLSNRKTITTTKKPKEQQQKPQTLSVSGSFKSAHVSKLSGV
jgi:hypothetical protein